MCGFTGFLTTDACNESEMAATISRMAQAIHYRGPDDSGFWVHATEGIALGHRRLSIIDLSAAGHQPMFSANGRWATIFNGEIYNHLDLRAELQANDTILSWKGHSDTETLLAGISKWGVVQTLKTTVGMFSLALWDRHEHTLTLARDRFGEKPLYYGWINGDFVFGSELKALRAYPGFNNPISRKALAQYLRFLYVPAPASIYEGISKLEPGQYLQVKQSAGKVEVVQKSSYWSLSDVVAAGMTYPCNDEIEALAQLEAVLLQSVKGQMLADVPLGAFLSGGVDSSLIVSLMQQQSARPVKTFTVGFEEAGFDESPHAKAVARHLGTDHYELFVTAKEALEVAPQLPCMYDEPFADSSQIPTHLVCRAARQQVTVALSGDGGDELFGGYNRYFWGPRIWNKLAWMPYPLRKLLGKTIRNLPVHSWDRFGGLARVNRLGDKAHKLGASLLYVRSLDDLYLSLVSEWMVPESLIQWHDESPASRASFLPPFPSSLLSDFQNRMMYWDSLTYLPNDILCKVDRAAMAVSLETRVPFLDHRVTEVAWRLPLSMKIRNNQGKWALRQILYKHVPAHLIERPKAGFALPVGQWLREPLRDWAESLLDEKRLRQEGYFLPGPVRTCWSEHLSGRRDHTNALWAVLMFQAWLETQTHIQMQDVVAC